MSPFFCSDLARSENEQLFGTVKPTRLYLALEYWPAWDRKAVNSPLLGDEIRQFIMRVRERIPESRFLLVRQKESKHRKPSCFIAIPGESSSELYQFQLDEYRDILSLDIPSLLAGASRAERRPDSLFLVCNHAKHDKCCAKYGNPVLDMISKLPACGDVWESSHVGGCRFAANLVCLPHGLVYGHLSPEDSVQVIREHQEGTILLPKFRGRATFPKPVQAAEYYVRREIGIRGIDQLLFVSSHPAESNAWTTTFALAGEQSRFSVRHTASRSEYPRQVACSDVELQFTWTHHLGGIEHVVFHSSQMRAL